MLTTITSKSLPGRQLNHLERARQPVQLFRAEHRAVVVDQRQQGRLLAEVVAEMNRLAGLIDKRGVKRKLRGSDAAGRQPSAAPAAAGRPCSRLPACPRRTRPVRPAVMSTSAKKSAAVSPTKTRRSALRAQKGSFRAVVACRSCMHSGCSQMRHLELDLFLSSSTARGRSGLRGLRRRLCCSSSSAPGFDRVELVAGAGEAGGQRGLNVRPAHLLQVCSG